jgi:hypothetical protein
MVLVRIRGTATAVLGSSIAPLLADGLTFGATSSCACTATVQGSVVGLSASDQAVGVSSATSQRTIPEPAPPATRPSEIRLSYSSTALDWGGKHRRRRGGNGSRDVAS